MKSAFGVEHGEVSKGLKPANMESLKRVAMIADSDRAKRYAHDKAKLRDLQHTPGKYKGPLPISAGYHKKFMAQATRTTRQIRDKNRKPIFGVDHGEISKGLPSALRGTTKWRDAPMRVQHQLAAHTYGRDAARMGSLRERTIAQGQNQKASLRRIDIRNANKKKARVLP